MQRPRNSAGNLLPDQLLFNSIKACGSLFDCQQLLSANKQQLDAMLLSTLVTQTVYVAVGQPEQQQQQQQQCQEEQREPPHDLHLQSTASSASSYGAQHNSSSSSGSRLAGSSRGAAQALSRYLRQVSNAALQLCSSFRPQQFSNVLWGLAKCGYRAPTAWLGHYLAQVRLYMPFSLHFYVSAVVWVCCGLRQLKLPPQKFALSHKATCNR
jgi:hypothetical protein